MFTRAFGLNSETLREGGAAMLESEGEMGAALFAAASGL
ncbi:MAG: AAA family ATPase, partial [Acidimicrobiales bacterium]